MFAAAWFADRWFAKGWWSKTSGRGRWWYGSYFARRWFATTWWPQTGTAPVALSIEVTPTAALGLSPSRRAVLCGLSNRRAQKCSAYPRRLAACDSNSEWLPFMNGQGFRAPIGFARACYEQCAGPIIHYPPALTYTEFSLTGERVNGVWWGRRLENGAIEILPWRPARFFQRHWLADFDRFYSSNAGQPISWTAAPGAIVQTLDDYDSLQPYSLAIGQPFFTPWGCGAGGVPMYREDAVGEDGAMHAAILRLPFIVDEVENFAAALSDAPFVYGCCPDSFGPGRSYLQWFELLSHYGRVTTPPTAGYSSFSAMQDFYASLGENNFLPYPFRQPTDSGGEYGRMDAIDTGGVFEVYFDAHFSDPWDGTWPHCTGGYILYSLDPQGITPDELWNDWYASEQNLHAYLLETNAEGTIAVALNVESQDADQIILRRVVETSVNTSISGFTYPPADPFGVGVCCDETDNPTFNQTSSELYGAPCGITVWKVPRT